ncbi:MAG: hypothetical protein JSW51_01685 [Gemmatimonadota bacterium]|nr:MAG: hypothetical protein JSW51_01685 [Gemmatimonadota bacterium]
MLSKIKTVPQIAAAIAVAAALTFGATQALADPNCTEGLPPHTCPTPDDCMSVCVLGGHMGGQCNTNFSCCLCFDK